MGLSRRRRLRWIAGRQPDLIEQHLRCRAEKPVLPGHDRHWHFDSKVTDVEHGKRTGGEIFLDAAGGQDRNSETRFSQPLLRREAIDATIFAANERALRY